LNRLAQFYGLPADRLLPPDQGNEEEGAIDLTREERDWTAADAVTIDLTRLQDIDEPNVAMLPKYLNTIQMQPQDFNGRALPILRAALRAMACLSETAPGQMRRRLDALGLRLG